jgi:hypothetical protein
MIFAQAIVASIRNHPGARQLDAGLTRLRDHFGCKRLVKLGDLGGFCRTQA